MIFQGQNLSIFLKQIVFVRSIHDPEIRFLLIKDLISSNPLYIKFQVVVCSEWQLLWHACKVRVLSKWCLGLPDFRIVHLIILTNGLDFIQSLGVNTKLKRTGLLTSS